MSKINFYGTDVREIFNSACFEPIDGIIGCTLLWPQQIHSTDFYLVYECLQHFIVLSMGTNLHR